MKELSKSKGFIKYIGRWAAYLWIGGRNLVRVGFTKKGTGGNSGISFRMAHSGWRHWALGGDVHLNFKKYGWQLSFVGRFLTLGGELDFMLGFERKPKDV